MVDFFNSIYSCLNSKNKFLERSRLNTIVRVLIRITANIIIPVYFRTILEKLEKLPEYDSFNSKSNIIVSLTTFPDRINRVWIVIVCILLQDLRPNKIILWLSKNQFSGDNDLPKNLIRLKKFGLEIVFCDDDLRSHKKYIYAFKEYPNDIIITVDDDVIYSKSILSELISISKKNPFNVCANHAVYLNYNEENKLLPYVCWENVENVTCNRVDIMPIGIGGVLYPPHAMYKDVFDVKLIKELCFSADDIWLNAMTRINNTKISRTNYNLKFLPIINFSKNELTKSNVIDGLNDKQILRVRDYYMKKLNINPFECIF